jgi:uncharacterized protein YkwD
LKIVLLLIAALAAAPRAGADVLEAVNWTRQHGCVVSGAPVPVIGAPFKNSVALQKAARRLAGGEALQDALAAERYLSSESVALHFSGAVSDAQIARALSAQHCGDLTNPKLREIGADRRGREVWMILAAPVFLLTAADAESVSRQILGLVNEARAAGRRCGGRYFAPAAPLTLDPRLTRAALAHSQEMARYGEFTHRGHDGSTPVLRVARTGYGGYRVIGENIAAGAMTPVEVTRGWLASPAHCENIMDGRFNQIGIAYAANLDSAAGMYWTQDFAAPR